MVHPDTELRYVNDHIGWGVFATRPIPRGTIIWALDTLDQKFTPDEVAALPFYARAILDKYAYIDARGRHILCWDHARYFNHSCAANCLSLGYDFELAIRDIGPGEELTDDYGTLNPLAPFPCLCGAHDCRSHVLPDDFTRLGDHWNTAAREAFFLIPSVSQPLWPVVSELPEIEAALDDPNRLRSIHSHYRARTSARLVG
ncbi:MAG: SET domain-containing protein [Verrucomicrobia bacterium]|nr:SET domain-containing protein [Verrucomicrobiota bacterium]